MEKIGVLKKTSIGKRVAEDEGSELKNYFVKTDQWEKIYSGDIDIIYGPKGSGKSALYLLLIQNKDILAKNNILLEPAENIKGSTIFSDIKLDPPTSESSFIFLWKIFIFLLLLKNAKANRIGGKEVQTLIRKLENLGIIPQRASLLMIFKSARNMLDKLAKADISAMEITTAFDQVTGAPTFSGKLEFQKGKADDRINKIQIDELLDFINKKYANTSKNVWVLFDRLDVAFIDNKEIEKNALRALFRVYNDFKRYSNVSLKIFVRDDIWKRITEGGFSEASHITKSTDISWNENGIINLIVSRLMNNREFGKYVDMKKNDVMKDFKKQEKIIKMVFPDQIDSGKNPKMIDWIITRTYDSSKRISPREIIHLIDEAKKDQIKKLERGERVPEKKILISRASFKEAIQVVSKVRYQQTLCAEYSEYRQYMDKLNGEKAELSVVRLMELWEISKKEVESICNELCQIGFFEKKGERKQPTYWVPFVYRDALDLIRGKSD